MTCTCSAVFIGEPIIMDHHYDVYGHSSSGSIFNHHINSLVLTLSRHITSIVVIILTVSLYLILSSLPLTSKHRKSWWKTRQRTFINSLGVITKAMRSWSIAALHTRNSPGMSSVLLKANGNDDGIKWREVLLDWVAWWVHKRVWHDRRECEPNWWCDG